MVLYMWATGVGVSSIYSVFGAISASSNLTLEDLNQGTGYMVREIYDRSWHDVI